MKNHTRVGGKLLQTNKRFSHLKQTQKEWILGRLRTRYIEALKESGGKPSNQVRDQILDDVYAEIEERDIWIPYGEVKKYYFSKISKFINVYRKSSSSSVEQNKQPPENES